MRRENEENTDPGITLLNTYIPAETMAFSCICKTLSLFMVTYFRILYP